MTQHFNLDAYAQKLYFSDDAHARNLGRKSA